jgi:hypothetical protein
MAEEAILPWESEEAQDWESDDAFAEYDESAEDFGEAARRRPRRYLPAPRYAPVGGVSGITVSSPAGPRKIPFPEKVARAAETNRALATQERARQNVEYRLDRLQDRLRVQQRSDVSVNGIVTLIIGGGLTAVAVVGAAKASGGLTFNNYANQEAAKISTFASAGQLATTLAKSATSRHYTYSPLGVAGDFFAVAQIAAFAFGSLSTTSKARSQPIKMVIQNKDQIDGFVSKGTLQPSDFVVTSQDNKTWEVVTDSNNTTTFRQVIPD